MKQTKEHRLAISRSKIGKKLSEETKRKIGIANRGIWIEYKCDTCQKICTEKQSHYKKSEKHFCSRKCQGVFYAQIPFWKHVRYRGIRKEGEPKWIYSARYRKSHAERISHLKARRYARERHALGSHTLKEWVELKKKYNQLCAHCKESKPLTKDHKVPLSEGGTDFISNIQPLCRNCNSRKWKKFLK